jgi:hypothetical protein
MLDVATHTMHEAIRDRYLRLAQLIIKYGGDMDFEIIPHKNASYAVRRSPRQVIGPCKLLEEAIEERERWVARRGLALLLEGLNTTAATGPGSSLAPTHRCNNRSTWCCCTLAKLRKSQTVPAIARATASTAGSTKGVHTRLTPIHRVIANTDLTKNIIAFL